MRALGDTLLSSQMSDLNEGFRQSLEVDQFAAGFNMADRADKESKDVGSFGLTVLSYNILADAYTKEWNMDTQYANKKSTPEVVQDFSYRSRRIIKEIFEQGRLSDIICLQEVDKFEQVYQAEFDKHGYAYELNYRNNKDAVLVGYNKSKFKLVDKLPVSFNDIGVLNGWSEDYQKGNQALLCLLEHLETGQKFVIVSTHFHWNSDLDFVKYA